MGSYLSSPMTEHVCDYGSDTVDDGLNWGVTSMQGWRIDQEDAHAAIIELSNVNTSPCIRTHMFGVWDGHGGKEVSAYCAKYYSDILLASSHFANSNFREALIESFLTIDREVITPDAQQELSNIALSGDKEDTPNVNALLRDKSALIELLKNSTPEELADMGIDVNSDALVLNSDNEDDGEDEDYIYSEPEGDEEEEEEEEENNDTTSKKRKASSFNISNNEHNSDSAVVKRNRRGETAAEDLVALNSDEEEEEEEELSGVHGYESGCTACVALLVEEGPKFTLHVANAGDSRCVMSRGGIAVGLSEDHKPEDDIELKRIIRAGGIVDEDGRVNGGLNVSRCVGDHMFKQTGGLELEEQMISALPDVRSVTLTSSDDFMVLCCDGIWNVKDNQEVIDFVKERLERSPRPKLETIMGDLCDACLCPDMSDEGNDGSGCDNMTALLVVFGNRHKKATSNKNTNTPERLLRPRFFRKK